MKKILFICHGNICRSPMAEFIFKKMAADVHMEQKFYVESCATSREEIDNPVYPPAERELALHGISCKEKRARQLTKADYQNFDLLICMERKNVRNALHLLGEDREQKLCRLLDFTPDKKEEDISDPWYNGDFETAYRQIEYGCACLLRSLQKEI